MSRAILPTHDVIVSPEGFQAWTRVVSDDLWAAFRDQAPIPVYLEVGRKAWIGVGVPSLVSGDGVFVSGPPPQKLGRIARWFVERAVGGVDGR